MRTGVHSVRYTYFMPLPPLRPLHPAWPMVGTIGFLGAALTGSMAGGRVVPLTALLLAAGSAFVAARTIRRIWR